MGGCTGHGLDRLSHSSLRGGSRPQLFSRAQLDKVSVGQRKNERSLAPPDSRGGCPHVGAVCRQHPGTEICIPLHCGEARIGDATFPETAFRVTLLGLRLLSNCYQSSHFHGCGAML
jgi:hypothetical protein